MGEANACLNAALGYVAQGYPVLPVSSPHMGRNGSSPGKTPLIKDWPNAASSDDGTIQEWWRKWPQANVGIVMGKRSGVFALDVDAGTEGAEQFAALLELHGELPDTVISQTGGGGTHALFRNDPPVPSLVLTPGLEIKSDGTYVVVPPSSHFSGRDYEWRDFEGLGSREIAVAPGWLLDLVRNRSARPETRHRSPAGPIRHHDRNNTLTRYAGAMRRVGVSDAGVQAALEAENATRAETPLDQAEVLRVARSSGRWQPDQDAERFARWGDVHDSDLGNAKRLVMAHGKDIRYVPPLKTWFCWDGVRWSKDEKGELYLRAKDVVTQLIKRARKTTEPEKRRRLVLFALRSENEPRIRGLIELAKTEPGVPVLPEQLDRDPWLINVANGTLDLRTGQLRDPQRSDLMTKAVHLQYDSTTECPRWLAFLDRIFEGNTRLISYIQRAVGYTLTGCTDEQVFFLLYGTGANGKSRFLEALRHALGEYARQTDFTTFLESKSERIRNDLARLTGARFVTAIEMKRSGAMDEAFIKQATGGDTVTARFLHKEFFEFLPAFKVWLAANHKPEIKGTDKGIWRRVQLIPFTVSIPPEEQDKKLCVKLQEEGEGILAWAVEGCLEWQRNGLGTPPEVTAATDSYREESDALAGFLYECCVVDEGRTVGSTDLYQCYVRWADQQRGEQKMSRQVFSRALEERGISKDRKEGGGRVRYRRIGLNGVEEARLKDLKDLKDAEGLFG
ncbi:MAG: ATP-binding protein [Gemmatimonadota bacterium]|nr:MAG: ATP-binding protein [Gemmatimonadota bacterium]